MKVIRFRTYRQYIEAQRRTVARRSKGPFFTDNEFEKIAEYLKAHGVSGKINAICHGVRNGLECDELAKYFHYDSDIFGTDLFPYSGKSKKVRTKAPVLKCDFSIQKKEWIGYFDVVYSNSLDHARDPIQTLNVWMDQLWANGIMFLEWPNCNRAARGGDCVGGDLYDCMDMVNETGKVLDLIYCTPKVVVIVGGRNNEHIQNP